MSFQIGEPDVAQAADVWQPTGEQLYTFFAFSPSRVVFAARVLVLHHGIANHEANVAGHRQQVVLQGAAVELKRIPSMTIAGDQLVHDADPGSDELVFGALADPGEIEPID